MIIMSLKKHYTWRIPEPQKLTLKKNNLQRTRKIIKQSLILKLNKITQFINNTLLKSYKYLKMIILVLYGSFDYLFGKQISAFSPFLTDDKIN